LRVGYRTSRAFKTHCRNAFSPKFSHKQNIPIPCDDQTPHLDHNAAYIRTVIPVKLSVLWNGSARPSTSNGLIKHLAIAFPQTSFVEPPALGRFNERNEAWQSGYLKCEQRPYRSLLKTDTENFCGTATPGAPIPATSLCTTPATHLRKQLKGRIGSYAPWLH